MMDAAKLLASISRLVLFTLLLPSPSEGWIPSTLFNHHDHCMLHRHARSHLRVTSQDIVDVSKGDAADLDEGIPYAVARGDGSTGGGGLPMPRPEKGEEHLARPKVGAEMPKGYVLWPSPENLC